VHNINQFSLVDDAVFSQIIDPAAAAQTLVSLNSGPAFVGDCEAFAILAAIGGIAATGTVDFKLKHGDLVGGGDLADAEGSALTQMTATDDNKSFLSGVIRPRKAYVSPNITRATADSDVRGVWLIKYGMRVTPVTQGLMIKDSESLGSPASGTA